MSGMPGLNDITAGRRWVATAGHDGQVRLFDSRDGSEVVSWNHAPVEVGKSWKTAVDPVQCVDVTRDETLLVAGTQSGRIWVRRIPSGEVVACIEGHGDSVGAVAFHPGGCSPRAPATARCDSGGLRIPLMVSNGRGSSRSP